MSFLFIVLFVVVGIIIQAAAYYFAAKITGNESAFKTLFIIALIAAIISSIPLIGPWLSAIVSLILLTKWCAMDFWPDVILTVVVSKIIILFSGIGLGLLFK